MEQPRVEFTQNCIFILCSNENEYLFWSPFKKSNSTTQLLLPRIETEHIDKNSDSKADEIIINVKLKIPRDQINFNVQSVFYMFEFDALLEYRAQIHVKTF